MKKLLILCLFLTSCAAVQPPVQAPEPSRQVREKNPAVASLVSTAKDQLADSRPGAAYATLERALQIDGRDPEVWHYMAVARGEQGQWGQVDKLARRSNMLTTDQGLRTRNDRLIKKARAAQ